MNRDDLQLFMTMFEEQNLMRAAELLYLSPSTAGARLRAMEDELGFELFERRKGVKASVPTPKGVEFSRIAAQMLSLWNEADQLSRRHESPHLSIATVDSFLDYNLTPLYRDLVSLHGFSLDIKCYPADMIYSLVSQKQADVGFALYQASMPHVKVTPVMSDDMVLVVPKGMSPDGELQPDGELPPSIPSAGKGAPHRLALQQQYRLGPGVQGVARPLHRPLPPAVGHSQQHLHPDWLFGDGGLLDRDARHHRAGADGPRADPHPHTGPGPAEADSLPPDPPVAHRCVGGEYGVVLRVFEGISGGEGVRRVGDIRGKTEGKSPFLMGGI